MITVREVFSDQKGNTSCRDKQFETRREALKFIGPSNMLSLIQRNNQIYTISRKKQEN